MDLHGRKKHSGKVNQLTLAIGGSEHAWLFIVAINWGNKMSFSLYANMLGFCSDGHICNIDILTTIHIAAIALFFCIDLLSIRL